jgi:hypothetical protein
MANYVAAIEEHLAQFKRSNYTDLWSLQALIAKATELERTFSTVSVIKIDYNMHNYH